MLAIMGRPCQGLALSAERRGVGISKGPYPALARHAPKPYALLFTAVHLTAQQCTQCYRHWYQAHTAGAWL